MMRNCFKRYDKANGNIDFNNIGSTNAGAANANPGAGNAAATAGGSAVAMSS